jgi:hypothetical protein
VSVSLVDLLRCVRTLKRVGRCSCYDRSMHIDSEIVAVHSEAGGWVWAILEEDVLTHSTRIICQAKTALATYEAAYEAAQAALAEWRSNPRAASGT